MFSGPWQWQVNSWTWWSWMILMIFQPISNWICEYTIVDATPWAAAGTLHIRLPLKLLHMGTCLWWLLWEGRVIAAPNTSGSVLVPFPTLPGEGMNKQQLVPPCADGESLIPVLLLQTLHSKVPLGSACARQSSVVAASESQLGYCLSCCSGRLSCSIHDWVKHPKKKKKRRKQTEYCQLQFCAQFCSATFSWGLSLEHNTFS